MSSAAIRRAARFSSALSGLGLLVAFWALAAAGLDNPVLLPSPAEVAGVLGEVIGSGAFHRDLGASLRRVLGGYVLASGLAVPLALVMAAWGPLRQSLLPVVSLLRPIPPIAWIPLAILWFGLGDAPSFFITAIAAFFPIFLNAFAGGLAVGGRYLDAARCLGATRLALLLEVRLPAALPMIATGLRIGLGQSWMAVVTAELIAAQSGLGYMIQANRLTLQTAHVLVGMVTIGTLGALMTWAFTLAERRLLVPWQEN
ncbi:ABC transporter permease [Paramagnetospirillum magneticum]|uniref:ABC-type nitrate/sulfonate/bicarbonate transport system, permease component n=1 Tax=Paramagnetospirillum magneticum (strain ATCC 700264 / AMB-1) TaxID=342108 RepID=Q2W666_PARM1|nr:ABC transporter permease [Paramagnetospirillum magneticum]BAE50659.1 ABC-type nitrate/sulfonate/bicarbonate transport system, permease component [Paramagnetospirillum magneticum AMB-1]